MRQSSTSSSPYNAFGAYQRLRCASVMPTPEAEWMRLLSHQASLLNADRDVARPLQNRVGPTAILRAESLDVRRPRPRGISDHHQAVLRASRLAAPPRPRTPPAAHFGRSPPRRLGRERQQLLGLLSTRASADQVRQQARLPRAPAVLAHLAHEPDDVRPAHTRAPGPDERCPPACSGDDREPRASSCVTAERALSVRRSRPVRSTASARSSP